MCLSHFGMYYQISLEIIYSFTFLLMIYEYPLLSPLAQLIVARLDVLNTRSHAS